MSVASSNCVRECGHEEMNALDAKVAEGKMVVWGQGEHAVQGRRLRILQQRDSHVRVNKMSRGRRVNETPVMISETVTGSDRQ